MPFETSQRRGRVHLLRPAPTPSQLDTIGRAPASRTAARGHRHGPVRMDAIGSIVYHDGRGGGVPETRRERGRMAGGAETGPLHPDPPRRSGYRYCFADKPHGHAGPEVSRWAPALSRREEFGIFD